MSPDLVICGSPTTTGRGHIAAAHPPSLAIFAQVINLKLSDVSSEIPLDTLCKTALFDSKVDGAIFFQEWKEALWAKFVMRRIGRKRSFLTDPDALAEALAPFAADLALVGLETGCWTTWLWHSLQERGLPVVCMDARQAHAALSVTMNKTDSNDARGLAHLLRTGLYRQVRVKSWEDMRKRALLRARATVLRATIDLANAVRGDLRTFGLALAAGPGEGEARAFERRAIAHLAARPDLVPILAPLLDARAAPLARRSPDMTGRSAASCGRTRAAAC